MGPEDVAVIVGALVGGGLVLLGMWLGYTMRG